MFIEGDRFFQALHCIELHCIFWLGLTPFKMLPIGVFVFDASICCYFARFSVKSTVLGKMRPSAGDEKEAHTNEWT